MGRFDEKYIDELERKILEARFIVLHCKDGVISNVHRNKLLETLKIYDLKSSMAWEAEEQEKSKYEESIF